MLDSQKIVLVGELCEIDLCVVMLNNQIYKGNTLR